LFLPNPLIHPIPKLLLVGLLLGHGADAAFLELFVFFERDLAATTPFWITILPDRGRTTAAGQVPESADGRKRRQGVEREWRVRGRDCG